MDPSSQKPVGGHLIQPSQKMIFLDTKQWIGGRLWKNKKECVKELQVDAHKFETWYTGDDKGDDKDPKFTLELRIKIRDIKDARAVQKNQPWGVAPVATKPAGAPVATKPAGAPVAATGAGAPVVTKPAGVPVAATGAGAPVAPRQQCTACRGKHSKHTCMRPAPVIVPAVVRRPRPTLEKRVADLEQTVKSLTAELQLVKQQVEMNTELTNLVALAMLLNGAQASPLNDQPAPGESSQEGSSSSKKARLS